MNKLTVVFALGVAALVTSGASAIDTNGDWSDWFSYTGNVNDNNWREDLVTLQNTNIRTLVDEEGPTPGAGGQLYDIEQIFYHFEDFDANDPNSGGRLHIGLVTGFPAVGVPADDLYAGDMFVDFGNTGGGPRGINFDVAIATSEAAHDSARAGRIWLNDNVAGNWDTIDVDYTQFFSSNPYRVNESVVPQPSDRTTEWSPVVEWGTVGKHNFLEISFDVAGFFEDALTNDTYGGLGLHWTMECGNDVINVQDSTPFAPVPEPSTLALLGMGIVGGMLRKKFSA